MLRSSPSLAERLARLTVTGAVRTLQWPTQNGDRYRVQHSSDLRLWTNVLEPIEGNGVHDDWEINLFGDLDTQNDGLSDGYEIAVTSDPGAFDNPYQAPGPLGLFIFTPVLW